MDPVVEGELRTPDGYWIVEIVRYAPKVRWYRISHGTTVVAERAPIGTVQRILGGAYATLEPVDTQPGSVSGTA